MNFPPGDLGFWLQKLDELQLARLKELEQQTGTGREQLLAGLERLRQAGEVVQLAEQWVTAEAGPQLATAVAADRPRLSGAQPFTPWHAPRHFANPACGKTGGQRL